MVARGNSILLSNFNVKNTHPIHTSLYTHGPPGYKYGQYLAPRFSCWARTFRNVVLGLPEYDVIPNTDDDAVFSIGLLPKTKKPWMAFMENYTVFSNNLYYPPLKRRSVKRIAKKMVGQETCHKIVAYTDIAAEGIRKFLGDKRLGTKIDTLHPVMPDKNIKKIKHDVPTILFVANVDFEGKGGKEVFAVADAILKKYDAHFIVKSPVPEKYFKKYRGNKRITLITKRISDDELEQLYAKSDIYLFPLYTASFGVFLEAKRASLPIITTSIFDIPEIVLNEVNGLTVDNPLSFWQPDFYNRWPTRAKFNEEIARTRQPKMERDLINATARLIEDVKLRKRLGVHGKKEIVSGRFSIKERNKKLKKLYEGLLP